MGRRGSILDTLARELLQGVHFLVEFEGANHKKEGGGCVKKYFKQREDSMPSKMQTLEEKQKLICF